MLKVGENNEQRGGIRKLGEIRTFSSDAFLFPTWRKQLGPFRSLSEAPAGSRTLEEEGRTVSSCGFQGSLFLAPPLLPLLPAFHPWERSEGGGYSSYLCLCDLCKPGYALLNGTEGRGRPTSQSPQARGRTQRKVVCSSMFYPVSTHTCMMCYSTEQRLTWGFLGL